MHSFVLPVIYFKATSKHGVSQLLQMIVFDSVGIISMQIANLSYLCQKVERKICLYFENIDGSGATGLTIIINEMDELSGISKVGSQSCPDIS